MTSPLSDKIRVPAALWTGLKRVGIAPAEVVRRANISVSVIRDDAPVSTMQFFTIWRTLVDISSDPAIGLRIATALDGGVMPPSFLAAYHARDFRDALQRVARFKRLCAPENVLIEERNDECHVALRWPHSEDKAVPPALVDATFASLVELGRRGTAAPLVPQKVQLARAESAKGQYERYYGCRVHFGARKDCLTFRRADLERPFVSYNAELLEILIPEFDRRLDQLSHSASLAEQIGEQLSGTSVTVVLVGPETSNRRWVQYELQESYAKGNGLLAVTLHNIKDFSGHTDTAGNTTFGSLGKDKNGNEVYFFQVGKTYDWVSNDGYKNFGTWVEEAAKAVGK